MTRKEILAALDRLELSVQRIEKENAPNAEEQQFIDAVANVGLLPLSALPQDVQQFLMRHSDDTEFLIRTKGWWCSRISPKREHRWSLTAAYRIRPERTMQLLRS